MEGEGAETQRKHETFAADTKAFLQRLMDGVSGLAAWREAATAGAKVRWSAWTCLLYAEGRSHPGTSTPPLSAPRCPI